MEHKRSPAVIPLVILVVIYQQKIFLLASGAKLTEVVCNFIWWTRR